MSIDEAIKYYTKMADQREIADEEKSDYDKWNETRFITKKQSAQEIADNRQLVVWLKELKEAKRLLRQAMKDMKTIYESGKDEGCYGIEFKWRYANEAEKLLDGDVENEKI